MTRAARTGMPFEIVLQAIDTIKHLIPKPGLKYNHQNVNYVQPELTIAKVDGEFIIIQNAEKCGATLTFFEFARVGIPVTVIQVGIFWIWLHG